MTDLFIENLLTVMVWLFVLAAVIGLPAIFIIWAFAKNKSPLTKSIAVLTIAAVLVGTVITAVRPAVWCPPELRARLTEEDFRKIRALGSGLYSNRLPLIPICVCVDSADGKTVLTTTFYYPFGTVKEQIGPDGYSTVKGLVDP